MFSKNVLFPWKFILFVDYNYIVFSAATMTKFPNVTKKEVESGIARCLKNTHDRLHAKKMRMSRSVEEPKSSAADHDDLLDNSYEDLGDISDY